MEVTWGVRNLSDVNFPVGNLLGFYNSGPLADLYLLMFLLYSRGLIGEGESRKFRAERFVVLFGGEWRRPGPAC